jgi:ferredoxin
MSKLCVNEEQCIGCGACVAIDSEHFDFNDNGLSSVISQENLESPSLKSAVESCPTGAIKLGEENCNCNEEKSCSCCEECTGDENCNCCCENCNCNNATTAE